MNPVKAKMVPGVLKYRYSSIHDYKNGKSTIIHVNAIKRYQSKFKTWKEFLEFHGEYGEGIFLGMSEEIELRYFEIAWNLMWEMKETKELENTLEILEEPELRKEYLDKMKETIKVSENKLKKIYKEIEKN